MYLTEKEVFGQYDALALTNELFARRKEDILNFYKACDCDKPCDTLQEKLDAGDENAKAEYEQKFAKKDDDSQFYEVK